MSAQRSKLYVYVEDDPLSRQVMELMAAGALDGARMEIFETSQDFLLRLASLGAKPDLILLDVHMKPVDGFELLAQLRADDQYRDVPVVALTASVMTNEISRLHESGFSGAIAKPISVTTFPALVRRVLTGEAIWHVM